MKEVYAPQTSFSNPTLLYAVENGRIKTVGVSEIIMDDMLSPTSLTTPAACIAWPTNFCFRLAGIIIPSLYPGPRISPWTLWVWTKKVNESAVSLVYPIYQQC